VNPRILLIDSERNVSQHSAARKQGELTSVGANTRYRGALPVAQVSNLLYRRLPVGKAFVASHTASQFRL
jgi:hypothetical protein